MFSLRSRPQLVLLAGMLMVLPLAVNGQIPIQRSQAISVGAYYAEGDYGQGEETQIRYFPLSYEANVGAWGFQLLVPHLEVSGLGNVLVNVGGVTRAVAGTERTRNRGVGDTVASAIYRLDPWSANAPFIDLRLDIKLPTADESKSLGSGERDYSMQIDLSRNVGKMLAFATIGYNNRGKSKLFPGLEDSAFLQLGMARPVSERWNLGVFYDYREAASAFSDATHELVPYVSWQLSEHWSITGLTAWGFTDASADLSVLGQLSYRW